MKIYPRRIKVQEGVNKYELKIQNSSPHDQILLFRIRRAAVKVLSFKPKKGHVLPGETLTVVVYLINHQFLKTRLLVKLVVLPRILFVSDFVKSWNMGCEYKGEVKKIVDIICPSLPAIDEEAEGLGSPSSKFEDSSDQYSDMISETSSFSYMLNRSNDMPMQFAEQSNEFQSINFDTPANLSPFHRRGKSIPAKESIFFPFSNNDSIPSKDTSQEDTSTNKPEGASGNKDSAILQILQHITQQLMSPDTQETNRNELIRTAHMLTDMLHKSHAVSIPTTVHEPTTNTAGKPPIPPSTNTSNNSSNKKASELAKWKPPPINTNLPPNNNQPVYSQYEPSSIPSNNPLNHNTSFASQSSTVPSVSQSYSFPNQSSHFQQQPPTHVAHSYPPNYSRPSQPPSNPTYAPSSRSHSYDIPEQEEDDFDRRRELEMDEEQNRDREDEEEGDDQVGSISTIDKGSIGGAAGVGGYGGVPLEDMMNLDIYQNYHKLSSENASLEVFGEEVNDRMMKSIVEVRIIQAIDTRERIVNIDVTGTQVTFLNASIGGVFALHTTKAESPIEQFVEVEAQKQLTRLRSVYYEEHVKNISIQHGKLFTVDASLNRFQNMTALNLSYNQIRSLDKHLALPNLLYLNLSYNKLKSLDYLQTFHSLQTLIVSHNRLASLRQSIHMLVPLARTLTIVDMTGNDVGTDARYAEEMVLTLPRIKYFDGVEIDALHQFYIPPGGGNSALLQTLTKQFSNTITSTNTKERKGSNGNGSVLPDFPCNSDEFKGTNMLNTSVNISTNTIYNKQKEKQREAFLLQLKRALGLRIYISRREKYEHEYALGVNEPEHYEIEEAAPQFKDVNWEEHYSHVHHGRQQQQQQQHAPQYDQSILNSSHMTRSQPATPSSSTPKSRGRFQQPRSQTPNRNNNASMQQQHVHDNRPAMNNTNASSVSRKSAVNISEIPARKSRYLEDTTCSKQRRQSQVPLLVPHWKGRNDTKSHMLETIPQWAPTVVPVDTSILGTSISPPNFPIFDESIHNKPVSSTVEFNKSANTSLSRSHSVDRGYHSDGETNLRTSMTSMKSTSKDILSMSIEADQYNRTLYDARMHPRYQTPKPVFGLSKPFVYRKHIAAGNRNIPLYDDTVTRLRDGFEKLPPRGTFPKAPKVLPSDWYGMDQQDHTTIRKQGFYHESIGDVLHFTPTINSGMLQYHQPQQQQQPKASRGDPNNKQPSRNTNTKNKVMEHDQYSYDQDDEGHEDSHHNSHHHHPNDNNNHPTDGDEEDNFGSNVYDINDFDDSQRKPFQPHGGVSTASASHVRFQQPQTQGSAQPQQQQHSQYPNSNNVPINVNDIMGNGPMRASSNSSRTNSTGGTKPDNIQEFDQFIQRQHAVLQNLTDTLSSPSPVHSPSRGGNHHHHPMNTNTNTHTNTIPAVKYSSSPNISPSRYSTTSHSQHHQNSLGSSHQGGGSGGNNDYSVFYGLENIANAPLSSFQHQQNSPGRQPHPSSSSAGKVGTNTAPASSSYQTMKDRTLTQLENDLSNISQILNLSTSQGGMNNKKGMSSQYASQSAPVSPTKGNQSQNHSQHSHHHPPPNMQQQLPNSKFDLLQTMSQKDGAVMSSYLHWLDEQKKSKVLSNEEDYYKGNTNQQPMVGSNLTNAPVHPRDLAMKAERLSPRDPYEDNNPLKSLFRSKKGSVDDMAI